MSLSVGGTLSSAFQRAVIFSTLNDGRSMFSCCSSCSLTNLPPSSPVSCPTTVGGGEWDSLGSLLISSKRRNFCQKRKKEIVLELYHHHHHRKWQQLLTSMRSQVTFISAKLETAVGKRCVRLSRSELNMAMQTKTASAWRRPPRRTYTRKQTKRMKRLATKKVARLMAFR